MTKKNNSDAHLRTLAMGLATLAAGRQFSLNEASDVQAAFVTIVRAVERVGVLEKRIDQLEQTKAAPPRLKAV